MMGSMEVDPDPRATELARQFRHEVRDEERSEILRALRETWDEDPDISFSQLLDFIFDPVPHGHDTPDSGIPVMLEEAAMELAEARSYVPPGGDVLTDCSARVADSDPDQGPPF